LAKIVLGIGTSHGPMLNTPAHEWGQRVLADRQNKALHFRGKTYDFEELLALRQPGFASQLQPSAQQAALERTQAAIRRLAATFEEARIDLAIICGNDQNELFLQDNNPALAVFYGSEILNAPRTEAQRSMLPPGIAIAELGHSPPEPLLYPGAPEFGEHLVSCLIERDFDVAASTSLPVGSPSRNGIPHAFGFPYRQIMRDRPPPSVPVFLNAFFPPNQPTSARSLAVGRAILEAVESWPGDERVALIGSGGLSHFVVDEELDALVLGAMQSRDETLLASLPNSALQSGSGEIKNWFPVSAAMNQVGLQMEVVDYVPFYRSHAGTGSGMGFALWQ
jgi:hypothetical protein